MKLKKYIEGALSNKFVNFFCYINDMLYPNLY